MTRRTDEGFTSCSNDKKWGRKNSQRLTSWKFPLYDKQQEVDDYFNHRNYIIECSILENDMIMDHALHYSGVTERLIGSHKIHVILGLNFFHI
jgi:hypothetical protein